MAPVRPRTSRRTVATIPTTLRHKLHLVEKCTDEEMAAHLEDFKEWVWPKGDLYAYIGVLNRLDGTLEKITNDFNLKSAGYGVQDKLFDASSKRLINAVLRFLKLLIDNCSNRKIFNSVEHLDALILTNDVEVLSNNLKLILSIQAHHRNALQLNSKALLSVAWNWPSSASLADSITTSIPPLNDTVSFQFFDTQSRSIHLEKVGENPLSDLDLHKECVDQYKIPKDGNSNNFDLYHRIRSIKVFDSPSRRHFIESRLLALSLYLELVKESQAQHNLLIYEPTLVQQLTHLLQLPLDDEYISIQSTSLICLESLAHYKTRVSEVLSCLNAGVNQGLLFTYIRNVTNKLSQSSPPSPQLVDLVDSIFSMISHLSTSNSGGQMLVGAGLITLLINLFKVDSSTLITKCLQLLDALLYSYRNALPIFINANGLTTLVEKIHHRVLASVEHKAELEAKSDNDEDVATTFGRLPVSESQAMKSSLRSIYRLLTSSGTEGGIRNLIDTTLLQDIHLILENRRFFGASITSFALNIMATFVHNEPTSLSIIQEAQLPAKFYNSIEEYIEPHIDILTVIFNVISACCLNENGLNEFMQRSDTIIGKIFEMFTSATHIKVLSEKENAVNIGSSVDELIRHQPSLKPKVLNAINGQLDRIAEIGGAFDCNEVGQYGLSEVARYRLLTQDEHSMVENVPNDKREDPFAMKCIDVMARFLESVFTNGTHAKEFLDAGGLERLGRFFGLPCLPYDFSISRASEAIAQLGRVLIEIKPEVTLMWSMEQVREKLESTRHIWSEMRNKSLFIKMKDLNESDYEEANATFRSLIELYSRVQLISDMFASIGFLNIRVSNGFFLPKLNEPRNLETLNMIGILDRSLTWEHLLLNAEENKETEFDWKELESGSKSSNEKYEKNLNIMMNNLDPTVNIKSGNKSDEEKKAEESTPSKLNYKSLSHLSMYIPQTATPFYQAVVKMFLYRRQSDQSHKKNSVITSKAMAQILVDHLQFTGNGDPRPSCAYMCQILKAINALFFDDRTSHNHLQTPLVFAFAQLGGVQLLTHRLDQISDELSHQTITDNEIPKSPAEMQQFRIYRILENIMPLFHTFAATRPLLESSQTGPLQLREADKSSAEYFNSNDFLVRLRSIIMPVLVKVCQSEWLSKAPLGQPTRLIVQTFLNIIKAEGEAAEPPAGPQGRLGNPPSERIGHLQDLERALFNMRSSPLHRILGEEPPTEAAQSESDATQPSEAQTSQPELPPPPHPAAESRSDVEIKVMEDIEGVMKIDRLNETLLQEMMSMDFPKYASAVALMYNGDDVAQAAEWLVARPDYVDIAREFELRQKRQKDEEKKDYETKLAEGKITPMNDNIDAVKRSLDQARQNLYSTIPSILLNLADAHYEIVFDVKDMFKDDKEKSAEQIGVKTLLDEVETLDAKDRQCEGKLYVRWHLLSVMISDHQFSQKDNVINQRERLLNLTYKSGPAVIDSQTPPKWLAPFLLASAIMLGCSEVIKTADDPTKVGENIPEVKIEEIVDTGSFEEQKNALFEIALTTFKRSKDKNWELKKADLMAVLQVLTLLTRSTRYSKDLFSAGGVQMLSSIFDGPLDNARGSTLFLSFIMRNLIEDDSLIKSTMHNELLSYFASSPTRGSSSGSKVVDVSTFTKTASPLALRDTKAFMEVIKENCMLVSDSPAAGVFHIKLRPDVVPELKSKLGDKKDGEHSGQQQRGEDMQLDDNSQAPPMPSEVLESILQFLVAELMRVGKTARKFASLAEKTDEEKKKEGEEKKNSSSEQQQEDPAQQPQSSTSAASDQEKKDEKKEESTPDGALEYFYACFILQSITEICASYPSSKVNLVMTNKKKQGGGTPFKPKVSFLNFLISELISMPSLGAPNHDNVGRKQRALAEWAIAVFVSTCSDTSPWTDSKEIPNEVVLSRKFVLDVISKLIKDNTSGVTDEDLSVRYARLTALSEIIARLIDARPVNPVTGKSSTESSVHMAKVMLEKNYVTTLTHALGDIDISFPHSKVTIGALLSPLERLTKISIKMAKNGDKKDCNSQDEQNEDEDEDEDEDDDDEDNSSDEDDIGADEMRNADRAGTPDLYRNSALGMYSGENYGEENDGDEDSEMDGELVSSDWLFADISIAEEDFDDMEVDFHHHHGSGNHSESSDDDSGSSDGDSDDMEDHDEIEEGEADDWIDEEDEGEEVDFDEDAYDEEEALNPIEENPSIFDEADPVIEAPTPDEEEAESVADPEFDDDGLIDDGFSETDEDAEEEGLAFRDEADVERAPRIGSLLDGRGGMGETTAIFGSPLLGGGSSRRRMFGGELLAQP
ncbi:hypothetical protein E3P86_02254 [Wallemia ichthyophaga]|uniref:UBA domain-containing protein n=1 Tax=Wallemia ichthyophaga TaxID=245174 RepID=A0A4T0J3D8_WALIC|nr:hypothetical protein E3P86_02254 [Wallemia ichthyophaga]